MKRPLPSSPKSQPSSKPKPKLKPKVQTPAPVSVAPKSGAASGKAPAPKCRASSINPKPSRAEAGRAQGTARTPRAAGTASRRSPALSVSSAPSAAPAATAPRTQTKQAQLIHLLGTPSGASMAQMIALTGWQPHTVRGALSGALRKRLGLDVHGRVEEGVRIYRLYRPLRAIEAAKA